MRKVLILAAALILGAAAFAQDRVSTPIVKALESGKFYMQVDTPPPLPSPGQKMSVSFF